MKDINNIVELIEVLGEDRVKQLFMEYTLLAFNKAIKLDRIAELLQSSDVSVDSIKNIVNNEGDNDTFI